MVEAISPRSQKIVEWYERRLAPVAFVIGFIFDSITFTRVDFLFDHVILIGHLLIAASGIVLVNAYAQGRLREEFMARFVLFYPLAIQFSFGALFSGFTVLFVRSGSFAGSWLFLVFLALILVGNEFSVSGTSVLYSISVFTSLRFFRMRLSRYRFYCETSGRGFLF